MTCENSYFVELTVFVFSLVLPQCFPPLQLHPCGYYWNKSIEIHGFDVYNVVLCECEQYKQYCSFACTFIFAYLSNNEPPEINQWSITVILPRRVKWCYVCYSEDLLWVFLFVCFYQGWYCFLIFVLLQAAFCILIKYLYFWLWLYIMCHCNKLLHLQCWRSFFSDFCWDSCFFPKARGMWAVCPKQSRTVS